jgi:hypothetical protein
MKNTYTNKARKGWERIGRHSMKDYPYWDIDTKGFLLGVVSAAQLCEEVGIILSELHRDKANQPHDDECECCECHGHEWDVEEAEAVGDAAAWVAVCVHCDATAHPDEVYDGDAQ